jgi:large subunit ribosomal protein L22
MLISAGKFKELCDKRQIDISHLAAQLVRPGLDRKQAETAMRNWRKGLFSPPATKEDIRHLAAALSTDKNELTSWRSSCMYAAISPQKARLVTQLINGRSVAEALDILRFTRKRAAEMIQKVLKAAVADADEQEAELDDLYISEARVDDAGIQVGTKRWRAKDRGRAHSIRRKACHIHVTVMQAS